MASEEPEIAVGDPDAPIAPAGEEDDEQIPAEITTTFTKATRDTPVGIVIKVHPKKGPIVTKIKEDSIIAATALELDMQLTSINGISFEGMSLDQAIGLFKRVVGEVELKALPKPPPFTVIAKKETMADKVGLGFAQDKTGAIVISSISETSIFANTRLKKFNKVLSVNGFEVDGMKKEDAIFLIRNAMGVITLVVEKYEPEFDTKPVAKKSKSGPTLQVVTVTAVKETKASKVGVGFAQDKNGAIVVSNIAATSIFANSELKKYMKVVSVDRTSVEGMSKEDAIFLLRDAEGEVTIVAEQYVPEFDKVARSAPAVVPVPVAEGAFTAVKAAQSSKVGVGFAQDKTGAIVVSNIAPTSIFVGTGLMKFMKVESVNGTSVEGMSKEEAIGLLREAEGDVTIVAERYTPEFEKKAKVAPVVEGAYTATKATKSSKVGVGFAQDNTGAIVVSNIAATSIFVGTGLKKFMKVESVNGTSVQGMTKEEAIGLLREAEGDVTIVAEQYTPEFEPRAAAPPVVEGGFTATKATKSSKVGVGFAQDNTGAIVVSNIAATSIFAGTGLKKFMKVESVNGTNVNGMTKEGAIGLLREAEGDVTIVAEQYTPEFEPKAAAPPVVEGGFTATKATKSSKVGVGFAQDNTGAIVVSNISPTSIFVGTGLKKFMKVESVNGTNVNGMTKEGAIGLLREAEGDVTIVAEQYTPEFEAPTAAVVAADPSKQVTAKGTKESKDGRVGVGFAQDKTGAIVVSNVAKTSIFAETPLKKFMKVVSINGASVSGMSKEGAIGLLREAEGEITIVAEAYEPDF